MVLQRPKSVGKVTLELAGTRYQPLSLEHVDVGESRGTTHRVARVRRTMPERGALVLPKRSGDLARDDPPADREVAARNSLGERDQVGAYPRPALDAEPLAQPSESADHLVGHEEHAVLGTYLCHAFEIALRGQPNASGADHRLAEEGGDAFRS